MSINVHKLAIGAAALATSIACGSVDGRTEGATGSSNQPLVQAGSLVPATGPARVLNENDKPGAALGRYRAFWPKRDDKDLAARVESIGSLFRATAPRLATATVGRDDRVTPFTDPSFVVHYKSKTDDLSFEDSSRLQDGPPPTDIGEEAARSLAKRTIRTMASKGIITSAHYDPSDLVPAHARRTEYRGDGKEPIDYVVEYRFRTLRKLNGIEVANNGLVIGISPKAELSSIRLGGIQFDTTVAGTVENPTASGAVVTRTVGTDEATARFHREAGRAGANKHVLWSKKMYVMPEGQQEAVLEPMLLTHFANQVTAPNGRTIAERGETVGVPLSDAKAPLVRF